MENYKTKYKKNPNEIALLGYETGLTIQESMKIDPEFENLIAQNLKKAIYETPRGKLNLNTYNELQIDSFTLIETKEWIVVVDSSQMLSLHAHHIEWGF